MQILDLLLSTVLGFLFVIGLVIFVHELGHLLVAKAFGVRVLTFSLGFGHRLWSFQRGETEYRVSAIPLGGYVNFGGQDPGQPSSDPSDYLNKPRWQRVLILFAGPAMNAVLAVALTAVVFMAGTKLANRTDVAPIVGAVAEGSPGMEAGLEAGDRILSLDGANVQSWHEIEMMILTSPDRPVEVRFERDGQERQTTLTPLEVPRYEFGEAGLFPDLPLRVDSVLRRSPAAAAGFRRGDALIRVDDVAIITSDDFTEYVRSHPGQALRVEVERLGRSLTLEVVPREMEETDGPGIGVEMGRFDFQRLGPWPALVASVRHNVETTQQLFDFVGKLFERRISPQSALNGPLEIASLTGAAARQGFGFLLFLTALISLNLCILNLLPIPILDGGQITILLLEGTMRRDLSARLKEGITLVGLAMVVMIMVVAIYFDVKKMPRWWSQSEDASVTESTSESSD